MGKRKTVTLWSICSEEQHRTLMERGRLTGAWRRVERCWLPAYRWMAAQMVQRGISEKPAAPVWAWHSWRPPERRRPDLRAVAFANPRGERQVRIEFEAPTELVLLSANEAWHSVLCNWYLSLSEAEWDRKNRIEARGRLSREMIESSWQRVFEVRTSAPRWWVPIRRREIQACVPFVCRSWVREETWFVLRGGRAL